jgi:hypothetical protein
MSADPTKVANWTEADVYVAPLGTAEPINANVALSASWDLTGLLDGSDGFAHSRSVDKGDFFGWGGILIKTTRRNFKYTVKFTLLEDNETTRELFWPGSTPGGDLIVPVPERQLILLETREGSTVRRLVSAYQAEIDLVDDVTDKEDDLTKYMMEATIFPDADGVLFHEYTNDLPTS